MPTPSPTLYSYGGVPVSATPSVPSSLSLTISGIQKCCLASGSYSGINGPWYYPWISFLQSTVDMLNSSHILSFVACGDVPCAGGVLPTALYRKTIDTQNLMAWYLENDGCSGDPYAVFQLWNLNVFNVRWDVLRRRIIDIDLRLGAGVPSGGISFIPVFQGTNSDFTCGNNTPIANSIRTACGTHDYNPANPYFIGVDSVASM